MPHEPITPSDYLCNVDNKKGHPESWLLNIHQRKISIPLGFRLMLFLITLGFWNHMKRFLKFGTKYFVSYVMKRKYIYWKERTLQNSFLSSNYSLEAKIKRNKQEINCTTGLNLKKVRINVHKAHRCSRNELNIVAYASYFKFWHRKI